MNPVPLNTVDHADLKVAMRAGAAFGDAANQAPLYPNEFEAAQREFAIVFRQRDDGIHAYALLGLDKDENLFLDGDAWTSRYVPAAHRRGPFSIAVPPPGSDRGPEMRIDMDDPRVGDSDGLPLFLEHGGDAPLLQHMQSVLQLLFEGAQTAKQIYADLAAAGLLQSVDLELALDDRTEVVIGGVMVIDQQALQQLAGDELTALHQSGILRVATMAAASLGNIPHLIALKNRQRGLG